MQSQNLVSETGHGLLLPKDQEARELHRVMRQMDFAPPHEDYGVIRFGSAASPLYPILLTKGSCIHEQKAARLGTDATPSIDH